MTLRNEFTALTDDTLAELRAINDANLPHLATGSIEGSTGTRVGGALPASAVPVNVFTNIPCRLAAQQSKRAGAEALVGDQALAMAYYTLTFAAGMIVARGTVVVVTGTSLATGQAWTRTVKVGLPVSSFAFETQSRYACEDVSPAGR